MSQERADRLIALIEHGFRYPFYTGQQIRNILDALGVDTHEKSLLELEMLGELIWKVTSDISADKDQLTMEQVALAYGATLKEAALEAGCKLYELPIAQG